MAKIHTETLVITISKLVKESGESSPIVNEEIISALEQVVQELVGDSVIVEVEAA
jgi:hypothetical protein